MQNQVNGIGRMESGEWNWANGIGRMELGEWNWANGIGRMEFASTQTLTRLRGLE
jgi:hypothetical protein